MRVLFFCTNGAGIGHLSRCLAYARRMPGQVKPVFFSLASAAEIIEELGFEADYFVSPTWSSNSTFSWNSELAIRFGIMLERVRPAAVVFDGTWPFQGFLAACQAYGSLRMAWSRRGLLKMAPVPSAIPENTFDLVIVPGELGCQFEEWSLSKRSRKIQVPPVTLLDDREIYERKEARAGLGLPDYGQYALFSLGAGNLNDISGVATKLIRQFETMGYSIVWAQAPLSVRDVQLPATVIPVSVFPLVRYLRAFDVFVGAAGYNTCCEVVQTGIPSLLVPNEETRADDQVCRAYMAAEHAPVVVSPCQTEAECEAAVTQVLALPARPGAVNTIHMNGAPLAADAILQLATRQGNT